MFLIVVNFIVLQCLLFFFMAIAAYILSVLGLLLGGRIDAFLSLENRPRGRTQPLAENPYDL